MKILESNNYKLFVLSPFNRDIRKTKALEASMLKYGYLPAYPIHARRRTDRLLEIISGHHRFYVACKLGITFLYVEDNKNQVNLHEIEAATVPWSLNDWLVSHIRTGKKDYLVVQEYHRKTGIGVSQCMSLLSAYSDGRRLNAMFKEGLFEVGNTETAVIVGELVIHCKALGIPFSRDKQFVAAASKVAMAEGFDLETMKKKIIAHKALMQEKRPSMKAYIIMLDEVYNRGSRIRVPLAFNAEEAVRMRALAQAVPIKFTGRSKASAHPTHSGRR